MKFIDAIGIYLRVSKEDEEEKVESNSIRNQRELLLHFIKEKEEFVSCKILEFTDDGYSGTNFNRPGIQALLRAIKIKEIQCIIVKDFSRFGRNYIEIGDYLEQIFPFLGIRFISINDGFDNIKSNEIGALDVALKNLIYDLYSKDLSKKITSALLVKKRKGEFLGSSAPYGYEKDKDKKNALVIDDKAAKIINRIFKLTLEGEKRTEIAKMLNKEGIDTPGEYLRKKNNHSMWQHFEGKPMWTAQTIGRILRNPIYIGSVSNNKNKRKEIGSKKGIKLSEKDWLIREDIHKSIVTRHEFDLAQETFQNHGTRKISSENKHLLKGILRCGYCNHLMELKEDTCFCDYMRFSESSQCVQAVVEKNKVMEAISLVLMQYTQLIVGEEKMDIILLTSSFVNEIDKRKKINRQIKKYKLAYIECYEDYKRERISLEKYKRRKKEIDDALCKLRDEEGGGQVVNQIDFREKEGKKKSDKEMLYEVIATIWVYSPDRIEIDFLT